MAHLLLDSLAYWLVNKVRYQWKENTIKHSWKEMVRIGNTQSLITTLSQNVVNEMLTIKKCIEPTKWLHDVYKALKISPHPIAKTKSVEHKIKRED